MSDNEKLCISCGKETDEYDIYFPHIVIHLPCFMKYKGPINEKAMKEYFKGKEKL